MKGAAGRVMERETGDRRLLPAEEDDKIAIVPAAAALISGALATVGLMGSKPMLNNMCQTE